MNSHAQGMASNWPGARRQREALSEGLRRGVRAAERLSGSRRNSVGSHWSTSTNLPMTSRLACGISALQPADVAAVDVRVIRQDFLRNALGMTQAPKGGLSSGPVTG